MALINTENFYGSLSCNYDSMIGFDSLLAVRKDLLSRFIKPGLDNAADIGCGTGLDSIALKQLGLNVTGFDLSSDMIARAKINSARYGVEIDFLPFSAMRIPARFNNIFSAAVSLGNSLANVKRKDFLPSIKKIFALLKPGGMFLMQILNYSRILKNKERIVGITEREGNTFIRFYDFHKDKTYFNILRISGGERKNHSLITSEIFPYKTGEIISSFKQAGFGKIEKYGGLNKSNYLAGNSPDLVICAFKRTKD